MFHLTPCSFPFILFVVVQKYRGMGVIKRCSHVKIEPNRVSTKPHSISLNSYIGVVIKKNLSTIYDLYIVTMAAKNINCGRKTACKWVYMFIHTYIRFHLHYAGWYLVSVQLIPLRTPLPNQLLSIVQIG